MLGDYYGDGNRYRGQTVSESKTPTHVHICGDPNSPCDADCMVRAEQQRQEDYNRSAASMTPKPKECPMCGAAVSHYRETYTFGDSAKSFRVHCRKCGAMGPEVSCTLNTGQEQNAARHACEMWNSLPRKSDVRELTMALAEVAKAGKWPGDNSPVGGTLAWYGATLDEWDAESKP